MRPCTQLAVVSLLLCACVRGQTVPAQTPSRLQPTPAETLTLAAPRSTTTPTLTPSVAPSQAPAANSDAVSLQGPLLVHINRDPRGITLVELHGGEKRSIVVADDEITQLYGIANGGCALIVSLRSNRVVKVDLQGGIRELLLTAEQAERLGAIGRQRVSADAKWLAYVSGSGNLEFDHWEKQNIGVISLANSNVEPYALTANGGAWEPSWAPNSDRVAFSDFDAQGVQQLFVAKPDWDAPIQITSFTDPALQLHEIKWSPDEMWVASKVIYANTNLSGLAIVSVVDLGQPATFAEDVSGINEFWWYSSSTVVSHAAIHNGNVEPDKAFVLTEVTTGKRNDVVLEAEIVDEPVELPGQLNDGRTLGFFSGSHFYEYDLDSRVLTQRFRRFADTHAWAALPRNFQDEAECPPHL